MPVISLSKHSFIKFSLLTHRVLKNVRQSRCTARFCSCLHYYNPQEIAFPQAYLKRNFSNYLEMLFYCIHKHLPSLYNEFFSIIHYNIRHFLGRLNDRHVANTKCDLSAMLTHKFIQYERHVLWETRAIKIFLFCIWKRSVNTCLSLLGLLCQLTQ